MMNIFDVFRDFLLVLANTGGLLGLFMGFSVVSIIELIYFMTFRPYCAYQRENEGVIDNVEVLSGAKRHQRQEISTINPNSSWHRRFHRNGMSQISDNSPPKTTLFPYRN